MSLDAVIPSWLALLGCIATDFGLDVSNYAFIGSVNDDPKAPVVVGASSGALTDSLIPLPHLILAGASAVIGVLLTVIAFAFVPITLLIPIFAVRFASSLVFSWMVVGIVPSPKAKLGLLSYIAGLLLLIRFQQQESTILDSAQLLSLYSNLPYLIFLAVCIAAFITIMLFMRFSDFCSQSRTMNVVASALVGSQAPALAKQLTSIIVVAFLKKSVHEAANLYTVLLMALSCATYWFWDRRLRACLSLASPEMEPVQMHIVFNIMALLNGVLLFKELQQWNAIVVIALALVLTGVTLLAQEKFASVGEKEAEAGEANRRSSWKEIMRKSSCRGSEIMRIGQPPALALPVRNMVNIVFAAPPSKSNRSKSSVLMVADIKHHPRKSIKSVVVEYDSPAVNSK